MYILSYKNILLFEQCILGTRNLFEKDYSKSTNTKHRIQAGLIISHTKLIFFVRYSPMI